MKLTVKSRHRAETEPNTIEEPHIIISISNPGDPIPRPVMNDKTVDAIYFKFDDIIEMPPQGSSLWFVLNKDPKLFQMGMAEKIVLKLKETGVQAVMVHCEMGVSRSAGVAAALAKHFNGDDSEFFLQQPVGLYTGSAGGYYKPNRLVYRLMLDALQNG